MLASKVAHRWYQMGVILGVPVAQLEDIRLDEDLAGDRESAMFTKFLRSYSDILQPTWQLLVDAVGHKAGGDNLRLAQTLSRIIAEKFPGMFKVMGQARVRKWSNFKIFLISRMKVESEVYHNPCICG